MALQIISPTEVGALRTFKALTKPKSAADYLPYVSKVALGTFGQYNVQASKASHCGLFVSVTLTPERAREREREREREPTGEGEKERE